MNDFGATAFFAFVLFLVFIFVGEPDLWDKWHEQAIKQSCEAKK